MMTLEHERYGNARQCMRYMHVKYIAYAPMFSSSLFEEHGTFTPVILSVTRSSYRPRSLM
jgi:hypothetical protein